MMLQVQQLEGLKLDSSLSLCLLQTPAAADSETAAAETCYQLYHAKLGLTVGQQQQILS